MVKRILKIFGIVCLCAVALVGGVVAYLAITGGFDEEKIPPTSISFESTNMQVLYDVRGSEEDNIFSFTILAQPEGVTERECTIKLSNSSLITFKHKVNGKWEDYTSNVFYLNTPIYFTVNNVTDENVQSYNDGNLTLTVEANGLLQTTMTMSIDRNITSISFKDQDKENEDNNKITNGLFGYELDAESSQNVEQHLEGVINQDYELEFLSAPLMALKPFANRDAKIYEIYYVEAGQPKLLTHEGEEVRLQVVNDQGEIHYEDCSFLRYDLDSGNYVLNSANATSYEFKLAAYKNYADQELYSTQTDLSLDDRLTYMLQKKVIINVSGTEADNISFESNSNDITLNLLQDNNFIVNNFNLQEPGLTNLGLTLTKQSGEEITSRYTEVEFLDSSNFYTGNLEWNLEVTSNSEDTTSARIIFYNDTSYGSRRSMVLGMAEYGIEENINFYTTLTTATSSTGIVYLLKLQDSITNPQHEIEFRLTPDAVSGKMLTLIEPTSSTDSKCMTIRGEGVDTSNYNDAKFISGNRLVLGEKRATQNTDEQNGLNTVGEIYTFKALREGVYLVFLGKDTSQSQYAEFINQYFETSIQYDMEDGKNSIITIKPIDGRFIQNWQISLYGIVVNNDGYYNYTRDFYKVTLNSVGAEVEVIGENQSGVGELLLPIIVNEDLDYSSPQYIDTLAWVNQGSYTEMLMFAPKVEYLLLAEQPANWETNYTDYYYYDGGYNGVQAEGGAPAFTTNTYYRKVENNYRFVEQINFVHNDVRYFLLGFIDDNNNFVNQLVATGVNSNSKIYPVVPQTKYLTDQKRLQHADEYVNELLKSSERDIVSVAYMDSVQESICIEVNNSFALGSTIYICNDNGSGMYVPDTSVGYVITNLEVGVDNVIITTKSNEVEHIFTISYIDYDNTKLNILSDYFNENKYINVISYFDFGSAQSTVKPDINFSGDYFENDVCNSVVGNEYNIIERHENITLNKDGEIATEDNKAVGEYIAKTELTIDISTGNDILNYIKESFELVAHEYNQFNEMVRFNSDAIEFSTINFIAEAEGSVARLESEFTAVDTLNDGNYIVIAWRYTAGQEEVEFLADKLYIKSREINEYIIDLNSTAYIATIENSESIENWANVYSNYYKQEGDNLVQASEADTYIPNTYYTLTQYTGEIRYQIVVGYNNGEYTTIVYAMDTMDNAENHLYKLNEGVYEYISTSLDKAFDVYENGGWINYLPFYAEDIEYTIEQNDYISTNNGINVIKISNQYEDINIYNNINPSKVATIKVKIVDDGNFAFDVAQNINSNSKQAEITVTFTYNEGSLINLASSLTAQITDLEIRDINNNDITSQYTRVNDMLYVLTSEYNNNQAGGWTNYIELKYDNGWIVSRNLFINVEMDVVFSCVLGEKQCAIVFSNPYQIYKSTTNTTSAIYGNTKYILAQAIGENLEVDERYLYTLQNFSKAYSFAIINNYNADKINVERDDGLLVFNVPNVSERTAITFTITYNDEAIDSFTLDVLPNGFITNNSNITLDDYNNNEYDLSTLNIKSYNSNIEYYSYSEYVPINNFIDDNTYIYQNGEYVKIEGEMQNVQYYAHAWEDVKASEYTYQIFTDIDLTEVYNVDIIDINVENNLLTVLSPINLQGVYYIQLNPKVGDIDVGSVKIVVNTRSNILANNIELIAKENETYTLNDLKEMYKLLRENDEFVKVDSYIDGKTYKKVGESYELMTTDEGGDYYIRQGELVDILWIDTLNTNLKITYDYDNLTISQKGNVLTYNNTNYEKIEGQYNFTNYIYNAFTNTITDINGENVEFKTAGENILYNNEFIYCKNNAYIFVNGNEIIVISSETSGKKIYTFTLENNERLYTVVNLDELISLQIVYDSFGGDNAEEGKVCDIDYTIDLIFDINGVNSLIKSNSLSISVLPYVVTASEIDRTIVAGQKINLDDIFYKNDANISSISYTIISQTLSSTGDNEIIAVQQGNKYIANIQITLNYIDNSSYTYQEELIVVSQYMVGIDYPFNIESGRGENVFNASIDELTDDINGGYYDNSDIADWLDKDTFKFDLALKGDIINLNEDNLLNISRYQVYKRLTSATTYEANKYYRYNKGQYELLTLDTAPEDWNNFVNFFTKEVNNTPRIEIVAVSASIGGNHLRNVRNNIIISGSQIAISGSFSLTGYVAFKVYYSTQTDSSYGYYFIKIVDDTNFDMVRVEEGRNSQTISIDASNSPEILSAIRNSGYDISSVANISNSFISNNNIYLFMIDNYDNAGNKLNFAQEGEKYIYPGQLIENNQIIYQPKSTSTIKLAVVLHNGTSVVYLCNYNIVITSNVELILGDGVTEENEDYNVYVAPDIEYSYTTASNNAIDITSYITIASQTLTEVKIDSSKQYSEGLTFSNVTEADTSYISVILNEQEIAKIQNNTITLTKAISTPVSFYLSLTYSGGFVAYIKINIQAYDEISNNGTVFDIGQYQNGTFNASKDLSTIIGSYTGNLTLQYSSLRDGVYADIPESTGYIVYKDGDYLNFVQTANTQIIYVKAILNDIVQPIERVFSFNIAPSINIETNLGQNAENAISADIQNYSETDILTSTGSSLDVGITVNSLTISSGSTTCLKVNVGNISSVKFNLYGSTQLANQYFTSNSEIELTSSGKLTFVHSAKDVNLRLYITIINGDLSYDQIVLYITLPKTYDIEAVYRVNGATYETMLQTSSIDLTLGSDNNITTHLFGSESEDITDVNKSRFKITLVNGNGYYGEENLAGLGVVDKTNPNYLSITEDISSTTGIVNISYDILTFNSTGIAVLNIKNSTMDNAITYQINVQTAEADYNNITFNSNLLTIKDESLGEYISSTTSQLTSGFIFAYTPYQINSTDGQYGNIIAVLEEGSASLTFKVNEDERFRNQILIDSISLSGNFAKFTVYIITMNGISKTVTLIVTNLDIQYGYSPENDFEEVYANTEGYKFTDNISSGKPRLSITNNTDDILTTGGYSFDYLGSTIGIINSIEDDFVPTYSPDNKDMIDYDGTNKSFKLYSVNQLTYITMIFNVGYTVSDNSYIIGRVFYVLEVANDIKIGMNSLDETNNIIDLYLGSYANSGNGTIIDLLESERTEGLVTYYNNVYITLERYSDGSTIENNRALYNGSNSRLSASEVGNYLTFTIDDNSVADNLKGKLDVNSQGKLTITGNSEGRFKLIVGSQTVTGYYEEFIINVHSVYDVQARYDSSIDVNNGSGYRSGEEVRLILTDEQISNEYAFNIRKVSYGKNSAGEEEINYSVITEDSISYQMAVFSNSSTISEIKAYEWGESWETASLSAIADNSNAKEYELELPFVPFSNSGSIEFYIVSVRIKIEVNGDSSYYFANYRVYNSTNIITNDYYSSNKTIVYEEGSWAGGKNSIVFMDMNNTGLYAGVSILLEEPSDWETNYTSYYQKSDNKYALITTGESAPSFDSGVYYQKNPIMSQIENGNVTIYAKYIKGGVEIESILPASGSDEILITLPKGMFENSTSFYIILKDDTTGAEILNDEWVIKSNLEITPKSTLPLTELFLRSEIANQDYYNVEIIGLLANTTDADFTQFVENASSATSESKADIGNYALYLVTYTGQESGCTVFTNTAQYYVLVGAANAIGFDFNGGNYYINLTIDQSSISNDNNSASIDLNNFIKVWGYNSGFTTVEKIGTSVEKVDDTSNANVSISGTTITLSNIDSYTSNFSVRVKVSSNGVSREIEVYFNFIFTAKEIDENGYILYSETLATYISNLTVGEVINDSELRAELLNMVKFNGNSISTDQYSRYTVKLYSNDDGNPYYEIEYQYNYAGISYSRIFKINKTNASN